MDIQAHRYMYPVVTPIGPRTTRPTDVSRSPQSQVDLVRRSLIACPPARER
jgi:hypothetical protein